MPCFNKFIVHFFFLHSQFEITDSCLLMEFMVTIQSAEKEIVHKNT